MTSDVDCATARANWYVAQVREGHEEAAARRCLKLINSEVLSDCFVPRREVIMKRCGVWSIEERNLFRGYVFMVSPDGRALSKALSQTSVHAKLIGAFDNRGGYAALEPEVQLFFEQTLDGGHVLRASEGRIENKQLFVEQGPLVGRERLIEKIDRHKSTAFLRLGDASNAFLLKAGLSVPVKC